jgi:hypothetical protein
MLLICLGALCACAPAAVKDYRSVSTYPTDSPTKMVDSTTTPANRQNTSTPSPVVTATKPTSTAKEEPSPTSVPLNPQGPWLLVPMIYDSGYRMNPDGSGQVSLSEDSTYATAGGSANNHLLAVVNHANPMSKSWITILDIPGMKIKREIPLLSYYDHSSEPMDDGQSGPLEGIMGGGPDSIIAWSPDGRYLAFTAAIEQANARVYVYDSQTDQVIRLTDNQYQAKSPIWSPDGKWVIYIEDNYYDDGAGNSLQGYSFEKKKSVQLTKPEWDTYFDYLGWSGDDKLLVDNTGIQGPGNYRLVDVSKSKVNVLYAGSSAMEPVVDSASSTILFIPFATESETDDITESGFYLMSPGMAHPKNLGDPNDFINANLTAQQGKFISDVICETDETQYFSIDIRGKLGCTPRWSLNPSPEGQWFVDAGNGLTVYDIHQQAVATYPDVSGKKVLWRPDSNGFMLYGEDGLDYISVSKPGQTHLLGGNIWMDPAWVGVK